MTIELYGTARLRAGRSQCAIDASSVGQALEHLARECPALAGTVILEAKVHPAFSLSLNGERFVHDPETPLRADDCLLLISADVGG